MLSAEGRGSVSGKVPLPSGDGEGGAGTGRRRRRREGAAPGDTGDEGRGTRDEGRGTGDGGRGAVRVCLGAGAPRRPWACSVRGCGAGPAGNWKAKPGGGGAGGAVAPLV